MGASVLPFGRLGYDHERIGNNVPLFGYPPSTVAAPSKNSSTLIRSAFDEVVRFDPPVWALFRTVLKDTEYAGITIGVHEKVLLLIGSANRDEARWSNPNSFEITRKSAGHLGFGTGIHGCVGQMVARLEGEAMLAALTRRVKAIELAGDPIRRLSTGLRAFSSVPVSVQVN